MAGDLQHRSSGSDDHNNIMFSRPGQPFPRRSSSHVTSGGQSKHPHVASPDQEKVTETVVPPVGLVLYCTVLYCIVLYCTVLMLRALWRMERKKRCTEINHETLRACRVLCSSSQASTLMSPTGNSVPRIDPCGAV